MRKPECLFLDRWREPGFVLGLEVMTIMTGGRGLEGDDAILMLGVLKVVIIKKMDGKKKTVV